MLNNELYGLGRMVQCASIKLVQFCSLVGVDIWVKLHVSHTEHLLNNE